MLDEATAPGGRAAEYLQVRGIAKQFPTERGPLDVIGGISFGVRQNALVSIVGPSGCGKTTLVRILAGLLAPDRGDILLNGRPITAPGPDRSVVFQDIGLLPWRTALQNVEFPLESLSLPTAERRERAARFLRLVGLGGFERFYPHELSGGMKQRVGIARALAVNPALLLCDEPFASLDAFTRETMQFELLDLHAREPKTVLFVTHDIEEALFLADEVLVLSQRPAGILTTLRVDIPRPRTYEHKLTAEFAEMRRHVWSLLRQRHEEPVGALA
jgi:NitT/TauT family transport system ATP-binding protein